jgi:DNA-binding transcriptional LysR family regulator
VIGAFVQRYPQITVDLNLTDAVCDVAGGEADVAIRFGQLADSSLKTRRLGSTGRIVVASPAYLARCGVPETPEDLHRHNCLNFNFRRAEPIWPFRRDAVDFALTVSGNIEANNGGTLVQLACEGIGIARVGAFNTVDEIPAGRLIPLLERFNPGDREAINLVFVGGPHMPTRIRVLVDFLSKHLGDPEG